MKLIPALWCCSFPYCCICIVMLCFESQKCMIKTLPFNRDNRDGFNSRSGHTEDVRSSSLHAARHAPCSVWMGGCKETVHVCCCHWLAVATSAAFTAKAATWPAVQTSRDGRPRTTRDTPERSTKTDQETELNLVTVEWSRRQGRNEGARGTISRTQNHYGGGESLREAPNECWSAEKSQQCHKYFSSMQYICFQKTSGSSIGAPNLLLTPGAI